MTEAEILDSLTEIFREVFRDPSIVAESHLTAEDVERWDSLTHIDMIVSVEDKFGIRLQTREVTNMDNVGDLVRLVQAKAA